MRCVTQAQSAVTTLRRCKGTFALGVYAACLLVICAFIVFEVLDLDGSDFPRPTRAIWSQASSPEPPRDLRRAQPHGVVHLLLEPPRQPVELTHLTRSQTLLMPVASAISSPGRQHDPATLPRASLSDHSSAA